MATNTLNGLTADIISQATLPVLLPGLARLQTFSTDFSSEVQSAGETVVTRTPSAFTASTWNSTNKYVAANSTTTPISVTLGDPKYVQVEFTPKEAAKIGFDRLRQIFIEPMAYAVVKGMQDAALALVVKDTGGDLDTNALLMANISSFDRSKVVTVAKTLSNSGNPEAGRSMHLGVDAYYQLISDNTVAQAFSIGGSEAIRNNAIGVLHGLNTYESQTIGSQVYSATSTLKGIGATKDAFMIASRAPAIMASDYADSVSVTEPTTGFTFVVSSWYNHDEGLHKLRAEWLYGVSILRKKSIVPILVGSAI